MKEVWAEAAIADLDDLFHYIAQDNLEAAVRVNDRIESAVRRLLEFPGLGRIGLRAGSREWPVSNTPYIVIYLEDADVLTVLRILHGARDRTEDL